MMIRQRGEESLHLYLSCFNTTILEMQNLDQSITMTALKSKLQKNAFLFSLKKKSPKDFIEMLTRVEKYAVRERL